MFRKITDCLGYLILILIKNLSILKKYYEESIRSDDPIDIL